MMGGKNLNCRNIVVVIIEYVFFYYISKRKQIVINGKDRETETETKRDLNCNKRKRKKKENKCKVWLLTFSLKWQRRQQERLVIVLWDIHTQTNKKTTE